MRYIITAYKPDSYCMCRGCLMETYSSDFRSINTESREEAIKFLSEILLANLKLERQEAEFELQQHSTTDEEIYIEFTEEYTEAKRLAEAKLEEEKKQVELQKQLDQQKAIEAETQRELNQLKALQAKYGSLA